VSYKATGSLVMMYTRHGPADRHGSAHLDRLPTAADSAALLSERAAAAAAAPCQAMPVLAAARSCQGWLGGALGRVSMGS